MLAALLPLLAAVADTAQARKQGAENAGQIVFASDRTTGKGVNNPEADFEVYVMHPDGKKLVQLTENAVDDFDATISPDGQKIAFVSQNVQNSNREGDAEVYTMNPDGSDGRNLTNNGAGVDERDPPLFTRRPADCLHELRQAALQPRGRRRGLSYERRRLQAAEPHQDRQQRQRRNARLWVS
jgi:hypothetical protein